MKLPNLTGSKSISPTPSGIANRSIILGAFAETTVGSPPEGVSTAALASFTRECWELCIMTGTSLTIAIRLDDRPIGTIIRQVYINFDAIVHNDPGLGYLFLDESP